MASHSPSPKLAQPCHLAVTAVFTMTSSSVRYDSTQQNTCRSEAGCRSVRELHVAMQRHIELIGAAWGLGGADTGCAQAPEVLIPLPPEPPTPARAPGS